MHYLFRRGLRTPGFSLLVVATIVFAVGVKAGLMCVTRSIFQVSPGIPEFDRLVHYTIGNGADRIPFSGPAYEVLHGDSRFADLAIWNSAVSLVLQAPDGATRMPGALVNGSFFRVMQLQPALGRFFGQSDDQPGGGGSGWTAVISYAYWKTRYRADPDVVGSSIVVDGAPVRIVGVLPEGFRGMEPPAIVQILLPRHFLSVASPGQDRFAVAGDMEWDVYGRLQKGETVAGVESALHTVEPRFRIAADPDGALLTETNFPGISGRYLLFAHAGELSPACGLKAIQTPLLIMNGLAGIILILSACNLIFLFAGHRSRQAHEAAIRIALGATRQHMLPGVLFEAIALAGIGSLVAIPLAEAVARVISLLVQSLLVQSFGAIVIGPNCGTRSCPNRDTGHAPAIECGSMGGGCNRGHCPGDRTMARPPACCFADRGPGSREAVQRLDCRLRGFRVDDPFHGGNLRGHRV